MQTHKIAVIAGDGIGPEVIDEGIKVLNAVSELDGGFKFEFTHFPWGCEYYKKTGRMMAEDGIEQLKKFDAIFWAQLVLPECPTTFPFGTCCLLLENSLTNTLI